MRPRVGVLSSLACLSVVAACATTARSSAGRPSHVDITWMSVTNMYYELGPLHVVTDGYLTRIPRSAFSGGTTGLAHSVAQKPDEATVARVLGALGGSRSVNLLLTGHSHFDHSFDTGTWSRLTGARVIGSRTTCLQVEAEGLPRERCTPVVGGEKIQLSDGVTMYVVRWNHSGDLAVNPEQHNPVELSAVPSRDPVTGGLRPGLADDFPNGGGARAYLFVVDGADGRFSWFFQNSASPVDLAVPIVVDGVNYGAPIQNLRRAMNDAGLNSVDLWIGAGGVAIAKLVLPILKPKAYLPVHWDNFWTPFSAGVDRAYADAPLEALLASQHVTLIRPVQYMDKWRLDRAGVRAVENALVKTQLGFVR